MSSVLDIQLNEIGKLLKKEKDLDVTDIDSIRDLGFAFSMSVQDNQNQQFSLLVHSSKDETKLQLAKERAKLLQTFYHANIVSYITDFTLGSLYFIQIERVHTLLGDWVNSSSKRLVNELSFLELSMQLLDATQYLINHQCLLYLENTIQCFSIDKNMKIKLFYFDIPRSVCSSYLSTHFLSCMEQSELFYYFPLSLKFEKKRTIKLSELETSWALLICFYFIAGANYMHLIQFILEKEYYSYLPQIGFDNNAWLFCSLHLVNFQKLMLSSVIEGLSNKRMQLFKKRLNSSKLEPSNKAEEEKQDFDILIKIQKNQHNWKKDTKMLNLAVEQINNLIVKYPNSEILLYKAASFYMKLNKLDNTISCCQKILSMQPRAYRAFTSLGKVYSVKKEDDKSMEYFQKANDVCPNGLYALSFLGYLNEKKQNKEEAIYFYKRCIDIDKNYAYSLYRLSIIYSKNQQITYGVKCINAALQIFEYQRTDQYLDVQSQKEQLQEFQNQKTINLYYTLGEMYYKNNLTQKAYICCKYIKQLDIKFKFLHQIRSFCQIKTAKYEKGIKSLIKHQKLTPTFDGVATLKRTKSNI